MLLPPVVTMLVLAPPCDLHPEASFFVRGVLCLQPLLIKAASALQDLRHSRAFLPSLSITEIMEIVLLKTS